MRVFCRNLKTKINVQFNLSNDSRTLTTQKWIGVVGLEVHVQISSVSKLFSAASTNFGDRVNNNVSLFDAAIPGTLPVINKKCVEYGVLTALALHCKISPVSFFDRKHYFYADLPSGYQITQQRKPLASDGFLDFLVLPQHNKKPYEKTSHIRQIQLEQDSGKSLHDELEGRSLVDLNRAGVPLMEIVFEPDLENGEEAACLVKELILLLRRLKTCNCRMEEGSLRVDANVSVHSPGTPLGVRSEVKNIGSVRGVANAIDFEIERQIKLLSSGLKIVNETRNWDATTGQTIPMRDKEEKQDYRFMPEPNLPPLFINTQDTTEINKNIISVFRLKESLPELPEETRRKLISDYKLLPQVVFTLMDDEILLKLFSNLIGSNIRRRSHILVANFLINELLTLVNKGSITLEQCDNRIEAVLGDIIDLLENKEINLLIARSILEEVISGNSLSAAEIIKDKGWKIISDPAEIKRLCEDVLKNNPKAVAEYKGGKLKVYNSFLGQIVKKTNNAVNMAIVDKTFKELLQRK